MSETLDAILEIDPATREDVIEVDASLVPTANTTVAKLDKEPTITDAGRLDEDFEHSRKSLKELVDLGKRAAEEALELAESGDSPRAYEVVGTLIANITQASKQLVDIHKTRRDSIRVEEKKTGPITNIDKAVFIGRASDLLRQLKSISKSIGDEKDTNGA